jgi:DNA end-binding protein Ku
MGEAEVKDAELQLAVELIRQHASEQFEPSKYQDEVRARALELIQMKVEGEDITTAPSEEPKTQIIDLMEALKASLDGGDGERRGPKRAPAAAKPAAKRARAGGSKRSK